MKHKKVKVKKITLTGADANKITWFLETDSGLTNNTEEPIMERFSIPLTPFSLLWRFPKMEIDIPYEFCRIPEVANLKKIIDDCGTRKKLIDYIGMFIRKVYGQNADTFIENSNEFVDKTLENMLTHETTKPISHYVDGFDFLRIATQSKVPKFGWKNDEGDSTKMIWDRIPGQETIVGRNKDGSFKMIHLTPRQKLLAGILYNDWKTKGYPSSCQITLADICAKMGQKTSGKLYTEILEMTEDLVMMTIRLHHKKDWVLFHFVERARYMNQGPSGLPTVEFKMDDSENKKLNVSLDYSLISGLNAGQGNIIEFLISHEPRPISKFNGLFYHTWEERTDIFLQKRGYIPTQKQPKRHRTKFFDDLEKLKKRWPQNPEDPQYPGFTFFRRENAKGEEIIHLFFQNTRGPQREKQLALPLKE